MPTTATAGRRRRAGLLVPLFSLTSTRSWGIGEIGDLVPMCHWLGGAGLDMLQILPVNEMAPGQNSPYSAMTAMAIDPIYISVWAMDDFVALGGEESLAPDLAEMLEGARRAPRIDYAHVRQLKDAVLAAAFDRFHDEELARETSRASEFRTFVAQQAWWIEDYALFRAAHGQVGGRPWWEWDEGIRTHQLEAIAGARRALARDVLYRQYLQWVADAQWHAVQREAHPVGIVGDLPFMVGSDSADVWARQNAFRLDATIGVPPDAFSETGQDWGLPAYRWDVIAADGYEWITQRARRNADLYSAYRIDHLVGLYRTYCIPVDGSARYFVPEEEADQTTQGETLLGIFGSAGASIIAEDLGTVPDFVRESLVRLGVPGYRVLRWEREWHVPGHPYRDPLLYPAASVATSGTHDTDPLVTWWEEAPEEERAAVTAISVLAPLGLDPTRPKCTAEIRDALLELLFASGSDLLLLPVQDVFGWSDRVNTPATVSDANWTWRFPWPVDTLADIDVARERQATLRTWSHRFGRAPAFAP
jgi:4-alpha-glucanotransferase